MSRQQGCEQQGRHQNLVASFSLWRRRLRAKQLLLELLLHNVLRTAGQCIALGQCSWPASGTPHSPGCTRPPHRRMRPPVAVARAPPHPASWTLQRPLCTAGLPASIPPQPARRAHHTSRSPPPALWPAGQRSVRRLCACQRACWWDCCGCCSFLYPLQVRTDREGHVRSTTQLGHGRTHRHWQELEASAGIDAFFC